MIKVDDEDRLWYLNHLVEQCQHGEQLIALPNWDDLARVFHNMKGCAESYGFPQVAELGRLGQEASESQNLKKAKDYLTEIGNFSKSSLEVIQN